MKQTTTAAWSAIILASVMAIASSTSTASMDTDGASEAPRPESYTNYSLYIQALFNYQKMQGKEKSTDSGKPCLDKKTNQSGKQDPCQPKAVSLIGADEPGNNQYKSLEDAISRGVADTRTDDLSTSTRPRSTFSSFPLNPITANDLSQAGVSGLLGLFKSLVLQDQTSASANQQLNYDNKPVTNADPRISNDIASMLYTQVVTETLAMGGNVVLKDGSGHVDVIAKIAGTGLQLQLSSNVRTGLYIVDQDGYPGSSFDQAGAVVVNSLGISVPDMTINIQGVHRSSSTSDLIEMQISSPAAITVDLSGTTIGVADAVRDGSKIGLATNFLRFGPHSVLSIAPGMTMNTMLSRPDGTTTPLVTLNGNIGSIKLQDISLLDNGLSVFNIGSLGIDGIQLVNTRVYIDGQRIIVDAGTGINNASISLERLSLGDGMSSTMLGDIYVSHINVVNNRMTVEAH
ncbi:MAG: hypothetical protein PSX71_11340 [bacterium]|nr:hypothetical protein [bacterium]